MSGPETDTAAVAPPADPIRDGLADPEIRRRLAALIMAALGKAGLPGRRRLAEQEEVFAETCVRALARPGRFDPGRGSLLKWLGGIRSSSR